MENRGAEMRRYFLTLCMRETCVPATMHAATSYYRQMILLFRSRILPLRKMHRDASESIAIGNIHKVDLGLRKVIYDSAALNVSVHI